MLPLACLKNRKHKKHAGFQALIIISYELKKNQGVIKKTCSFQ